MGNEAQSRELLTEIEQALVKHRPFGDSNYIRDQLGVTHDLRLGRIAERLPVATKLQRVFERVDSPTRHRVVGNTVIRCALQHAHTEIETGTRYGLSLAQCEQVFEETLRHLETGKSGTPFEGGGTVLERLGPESFHGWVWKEEYPDDVFGTCFRQILEQEYGASLCTLNSEEFERLRTGDRLLRDLLPLLGPDALGHSHLVACFPDAGFWKGKLSSSQIRMSGTIFLSRQMLRSPWCVAEHLLHESLHQKLYSFRDGHTLLEAEYSAADSPKVVSVWNAAELSNANHWDTHRAFAAFHVYVQLALLAQVAAQRAEELRNTYGPFRGMIESRKALHRARYLGEKLHDLCWDELGTAGKRLQSWLMSVLDLLDPAPPPRGAYLHLVLDLYQREANKVDSVLGQSEAARSGFARVLTPVAKGEVATAREVLSVIGATQELAQFDRTIGSYEEQELGRQFPTVRRLIAETLLGASPDGYGLTSDAPAASPDELVKQMVELGSEHLYLIQANLPTSVAGARRRAREYRFAKSCEDNVGRLLATLAATVPSGGRILEIGTGVGVGLAWLTVGLGDRKDVQVVSIEADPRLASAAAQWSWPTYVKLVTGDASEAICKVGTFNLVFVDAAPIKYRHLEPVLGVLRTTGILVIDDLHEGPTTTELEHVEKLGLRRVLYEHPEFQVVELDWSSGVMLATKAATGIHEATLSARSAIA